MAARLLVAFRLVYGAWAWCAPEQAIRPMGIDAGGGADIAILARVFASRELAVGLGLALAEGRSRRLWLQTGIALDGLDAVATVLSHRRGASSRPVALLGVTGSLAALGLGARALARIGHSSS
jgi:hypothetical protein